jgi:hypothetical protein
MNKKSKLLVEIKLIIYKAIIKQCRHTASSYGDAANHLTQKNSKPINQNSLDDNRCPLVRLKSNPAQRPQDAVCTRINHIPWQQIQTAHHWP